MFEIKLPSSRSRLSEELRNNIIVLLTFILGFLMIAFCYYASFLGIVNQVSLAIGTLIVSGIVVQRVKSLKGGYGLYMAGSKKGISTIDKMAQKNLSFWKSMPIWGIVLGFGLLSYPLLKGKIDKRIFLFGMVTIVLLLYLVLPCIGLSFQFINIPEIQSAVSVASTSCSVGFGNLTTSGYFIYILTFISGFSGFILVSLFYNAALVFSNTINFALTSYSGHPNVSLLLNQVPGVAPVIPGIDIPLVAGVISLAIILTIHELSHGVLARAAKVKIKSIGVLLFGVIPIGAYVEPNEKMVEKLSKQEQNQISAAGISANFIASIIFFALMFTMFVFVVPTIYVNNGVFIESVQPNLPANGTLHNGMQILYWDGHKIENITDIEAASANDVPGSIVSVVTNSGSYNIKAVAVNGSQKGLIGISIIQKTSLVKTGYAKLMYFLYSLFGLSFILNFLVAIVNLLPIPGFDGWRLYQTNLKSPWLGRFIEGIVIISLVLNAIPWLYIAILH